MMCYVMGTESRTTLNKLMDTLHLSSRQRVVGGLTAKHGQFPWAVFIHANHKFVNNSHTSNLCGGSLIHPR